MDDDTDAGGRPHGGGRGATRGSARGGADTAEALTTLTAMGFTPRKARGALQVGMGGMGHHTLEAGAAGYGGEGPRAARFTYALRAGQEACRRA